MQNDGESVSKAQQRLMGMVTKCQTTRKCPSRKVRRLSKIMDRDEVLSLARTKHDNLPDRFYEIVKDEIGKFLNEMNAVPCGKCGKQCPCEKKCESPNPTGYIINGTPIQFHDTTNDSQSCGCGKISNNEIPTADTPEKTPQMPSDQVTQFGNTPKMSDDISQPSTSSHETNQDGEQYLSFLKSILRLLKNKKQEPAEYNGTSVVLYKPKLTDENVEFYVKRNGNVKEVKLPKKRKNK